MKVKFKTIDLSKSSGSSPPVGSIEYSYTSFDPGKLNDDCVNDPAMFSENKIVFDDSEEWLTTKEAAQYLKISVGSLRNATSNGKVPYYKWGRSNRYLKSELRKLLLNQKRGSNGY